MRAPTASSRCPVRVPSGDVTSGFGDGAYPAFWGLSKDGTLVDLVVDFLVAVEDVTSTVTLPLQPGPVDDPGLAGLDFEVTESGFMHREGDGTHVRDVVVLDQRERPCRGAVEAACTPADSSSGGGSRTTNCPTTQSCGSPWSTATGTCDLDVVLAR